MYDVFLPSPDYMLQTPMGTLANAGAVCTVISGLTVGWVVTKPETFTNRLISQSIYIHI